MSVQHPHSTCWSRFQRSAKFQLSFKIALIVLASFGWSARAFAQKTPAPSEIPLRVQGPSPVGVRNSVTEGWSTLQFIVENPSTIGRDARVAVFYPERPGVQYARDIWVPARASVTTTITVGPAPSQKSDFVRQFETILYDRTGGQNKIVFPPGEQRIRERAVIYRKREQTTAVLADVGLSEPGKPDPRVSDEILTLARMPRLGAFSEYVSIVDSFIPVSSQALDTIDVFVVAGNRLSLDPPGIAALRRWLHEGGRIWVMLDQVDPELVASILGDDFDVGVVDTTELTSILLVGQSAGALREEVQNVDKPVKFVHAIPGAEDRVLAKVDGWPAAFVRKVGRGKVVFTTLGQRGWSRPRTPREGDSAFPNFKKFPVPQNSVTFLAAELHPPVEPDPLPVEVFQPMLEEQIGYSIVKRSTVAIIMTIFLAVLVITIFVVRKSRSPEKVAVVLPIIALVVAAVFVFLGDRTRKDLPTMITLAGVLDPVQGGEDSVLTGMYAFYHSEAGPALLGSVEGAVMSLDEEGLEGKTRVRLETDTDQWRWDQLSFPAGARTGYLRSSIKTGKVSATAKFGPNGIQGRISTGNLTGISDAVLSSKSRELLAINLDGNGNFSAGTANVLPPGQYSPNPVLTDKQQRRQEIIKKIHSGSAPKYLEGRDFILAWADAPVSSLLHESDTKISGDVLVVIPVEFEKSDPDASILAPRGLVSYKRYEDGKPIPVRMSASYPVDMRLRFQVPNSTLPIKLDKAILHLHLRAPFRRLTVSGVNGSSLKQLQQTEAPIEPIKIEINDPELLKLDSDGGIWLNIAIGAASAGSDAESNWKIELLSLELVGKTVSKP